MEQTKQQAAKLFLDFKDIGFFNIFLILLATWALIAIIRRLFPLVAERTPNRARIFVLGAVPILRLVLLAIAVMLIVPLIINPTMQNLFAIFGAAGVAIGFAFKDYVSSLIAGIVAVTERPYRPGDWVKVDDAYGEVTSVGLRSYRMVTPDDTVVTIPHLKLWDTNIYNSNDGAPTLQCVADFYLEPEHDAALVRRTLRDVALTSAYLQLERPIAVIVAEKPWATHYRLKAYPIDARDQFQFTSDLTVRGKEALQTLHISAAHALAAAPDDKASD